MYETNDKNVGTNWKLNMNLRNSGINKPRIADSSLIKGSYSSKNNASK